MPVVPTGFDYRRGRCWEVRLRFGHPLPAGAPGAWRAVLAEVEAAVCALSEPHGVR